jgi:hypothetical protein
MRKLILVIRRSRQVLAKRSRKKEEIQIQDTKICLKNLKNSKASNATNENGNLHM